MPVADAPEETWRNIDAALNGGFRGLSGGSSLARLLAQYRDVRNRKAAAPLATAQIIAWAKAYHERTGKWPRTNSGAIDGANGETWKAVDMALIQGGRGLPGGSTLPRFLEEHFGLRNPKNLPDITVEWICERAKTHHERTGKWPKAESGQLLDAPGETWKAIQIALHRGRRGLPKGSSLPQILEEHFGVRNLGHLTNITEEWICERVKTHRERTGKWPTKGSGQLLDAPEETWGSINTALRQGRRGLPGDSSLSKLLNEHFGVPIWARR